MTVPNQTDTERPAAVYRLYDEEGTLLYIGSAYDPDIRCAEHSKKPWWPEVARRTEEWHSDRGTAYIEEMKAIAAERSKYNQMGAPGYKTPQTEAVLRRTELVRLRARTLSKATVVKLDTERAVAAHGGTRATAVITGLRAQIEFLEQTGIHEQHVIRLRSDMERWQRVQEQELKEPTDG